MIQMIHVSKSFGGDTPALVDVNLHVGKGEVVFLTGPTGAGKTTLLRLLYGDEIPTAGQVLVEGKNLARLSDAELLSLRKRIGIVFEDLRLLRDRSAYENVALICRLLGHSVNEERRAVAQALALVDLTSKAHLPPSSLSGGERQRLAIARALVHEPLLLLADEPTCHLDCEQSRWVLELLEGTCLRGTTVIVATQDENSTPGRNRQIRLRGGRIVEDRIAASG
jgi:cell division transport system ATP-binding protein